MDLHFEEHGQGGPTLVLLHGLSVNGASFAPLLAHLDWPGRVIVPDLRGHGRSPHATNYSYGGHAADVADLLSPGEEVHVVGHSMGGAVGLVLGSGLFGVDVKRVTGFGIKLTWTAEEEAKARAMAQAEVRGFDDRTAAEERFLKVTGLAGRGDEVPACVAAGVHEENGRYRLSADMAASLVVGPPMAQLFEVCRAPVHLARGEADRMVTLEEMRAFDPDAENLEGAGHNAHVDRPDALARLIEKIHLGH